jgi:hypothetical protein
MKYTLAFVGLIALASSQAVHAGMDFAVDTTLDLGDDNVGDGLCRTSAGTCSLRAAIMQANHATEPGAALITVPSGTYLLTRPIGGDNGEDNGNLNLTSPLAADQSILIIGAGAATTIIDGNQLDNVFAIALGRTAFISGLTIRNGLAPVSLDSGGGIANLGNLTLYRSIVERNTGSFGGGIGNRGVARIIESTIRFNSAFGGGGVWVEGDTVVTDSTINENFSAAGGGGFSHNYAFRLYIVNSTISANYTSSNGGGIYAANRSVTFLYNTSVIGNDADTDHDELGGTGGGLFYLPNGGSFNIVNSLIAGNTYAGFTTNDCVGPFVAYGQNLVTDPTDAVCTTTNAPLGRVSLNTIDVVLRNNGGPTYTHALLSGSEAIDTTIDTLGCVDESGIPLGTDQRGANRVADARCDVGAFEFNSEAPVIDTIFANDFD